jgi:hypothetical protein
MKNPRVLLASPVNLIKYYIIFDWLDRLGQLTYDNFDIFLVDNSGNPAFAKGLCNLGYDCFWQDPGDMEAREYMAASNEIMRKKALYEKYEYLFLLECDIIPPVSIIEKLLLHQKLVVGAAYWTGHGDETKMQLRAIDEIGHREYLNRNYDLREAFNFFDGNCKPIFASGNGCILIHRSVLEKIKFRVDPGSIGFADNFFHNDILSLGILNYVDTSIRLTHYNLDWNIVYDNVNQLQKEKNQTR